MFSKIFESFFLKVLDQTVHFVNTGFGLLSYSSFVLIQMTEMPPGCDCKILPKGPAGPPPLKNQSVESTGVASVKGPNVRNSKFEK